MKDLNALYKNCAKKLDDINVKYGKVNRVVINYRSRSRWGCCKKDGNGFIIEISDRLVRDDVPDKSAETTMLHELIHTCKNCFNHGAEWKRIVNKVNVAYGYSIERAATADKRGVVIEDSDYRYIITCKSCGAKATRMRASNLTRHPERYRCKCGGKLFLTKNI